MQIFKFGTVLAVFLTAGCSNRVPVSVGILNESKAPLVHLYLSPQSENTWGADQLEENATLNVGESLLLKQVPRGTYDVKIVDSENTTCIIPMVDIRGNREVTLTRDMLTSCAVDTKRAGFE